MEDNTEVENTTAAGESAATEESASEHTPVGDTSASFSPDDALLERAVKAGMSLADAKALPSKEFAERVLGALEGTSKTAKSDAKQADGDEIPAIDFTGFGEEEGFDPALSRAMNSLKSVIEAQAKVIQKLKAGASPKSPAKAAEVRKNLTLARPGGESGQRKEAAANAEMDILSALRNKYKLN